MTTNPINYKMLSSHEKRQRQQEIFSVFLKLGTVAFGGPAAHIAMMETEIVNKRKWVDRETFIDLLGATNLIPGPNSTELAIHLGYERGGLLGLFLAGTAFIVPAMTIVLGFAFAYVKFGTLPEVAGVLDGVKPIIMAIILQALYRLGKNFKDPLSLSVVAAVGALSLFAGIGEIPLLILAGAGVMLIKNRERLKGQLFSIGLMPLAYMKNPFALSDDFGKMSLQAIFFTFLKIGSVLYGSGYVLLAFLESELVQKMGVITNQQLLDAVAVGQFTPGPVFTTATFVGYLIGGFPGAVLATIGIFLPAFVLVWLINPLIPKLRKSVWFSGLLDGVNMASLALMLVVTIKLGQASLNGLVPLLLFGSASVLLLKTKINSAWLILAGGIIGVIV